MKDFLIMTSKSSRQFRNILGWLDATERQLRMIMMGSLKDAFIIRTETSDAGILTTYSVHLNRPIKNILVYVRVSHDHRSPDGTQKCAFVLHVAES